MSGSAQPLGVADLLAVEADSRAQTPQLSPLAEHWYWCRRHECAERASQPTHPVEDCLPDCKMPGQHIHRGCIRVGPFMSEREANRLTGNQPAGYGAWALGMENRA